MKEEVRTIFNNRKGSGNQSVLNLSSSVQPPQAIPSSETYNKVVSPLPSTPAEGNGTGKTFDEMFDEVSSTPSIRAEGTSVDDTDAFLQELKELVSSLPAAPVTESIAKGEKLVIEPYKLKDGHPNQTLLQGAINRIHERLADGEQFNFRSLLQRHPGTINGLHLGTYEEKAKDLAKVRR